MADPNLNESTPWLEAELRRQFAPVAAPAALWDVVNSPRPRRRTAFAWALWPVVAVSALLVFVVVLRPPATIPKNNERPTERELVGMLENSKGLDFHSDDPAEIHDWVKSATNINVYLPARQTTVEGGPVRLLGARLVRLRGEPVAAIEYRTGDDMATLFVSSGPSADGHMEASKHLFSRVQASGDWRLFSWNMRQSNYAIAFSATSDAHGACLLCHANTPGLMMPGLLPN